MRQKYTSEDTSINTLNKVYKEIVGKYPEGTTILDYGCGKYDTNQKFAEANGYEWFGYDPYNRDEEENEQAISVLDYKLILCNNVLNVIKEESIIDEILREIHDRADGDVFFTIYEGNKTGVGKPTTKGYQRNQKRDEYLPLIGRYFNVTQKFGNIIKCCVM